MDKSSYAAHTFMIEWLKGFAPSLPVEAAGWGRWELLPVKSAGRLGV